MTTTKTSPSWSSIPHKVELAIICSIRIADFFQQAALQAVMFYQLLSFTPDASESEISFQVGVLQGVFTAAQIFTSLAWGKIADHPSWGRKRVVLTSLIGQGLSCLGVAFAKSFGVAAFWRLLGGAVNASVGGARTALSEKTEKKYHSRTFLLLPLSWNIAQIVAPPIGGLLSDPVKYHPQLFGKNSTFGGEEGVAWLMTYPYALPSLCCALVMFADAFLVWIGLEETLQSRVGKRDRGLESVAYIRRLLYGRPSQGADYTQINQEEELHPLSLDDLEPSTSSSPPTADRAKPGQNEELTLSTMNSSRPSPFLQVLTRKVLLVLANVAFLDFGIGAFAGIWSIFLSSDRYNPDTDPPPKLPFHFTGGLGFPPSTVGVGMSILGVIGVVTQLTLYPQVNARFGTLRTTKYALFLFPISHAIAPFLSLVFNQALLWIAIFFVTTINISARTFTTPGSVLLVNNSSPSPEVLGTIHGLGASVQAAARTLGPVLVGMWYSDGIERRMVGEAWWLLAVVAVMGCVPILFIQDG